MDRCVIMTNAEWEAIPKNFKGCDGDQRWAMFLMADDSVIVTKKTVFVNDVAAKAAKGAERMKV